MAKLISQTYDDRSLREDLWDVISNVDPLETYISSNAGRVEVSQPRHEWPQDTLTAQSAQAGAVEGADTTFSVTNPSRDANYTQIIEKGFKVSSSQQTSDQAGFADRFAYEQGKKMKEWKNQLEFSALRGSLGTGLGSGTGRTMKGLRGFASTLDTSPSGVSLSEQIMNDYLGNAWDQGTEPNIILVGKVLKRRISGFTDDNTRNVGAKEALIVGRVDVYDSDFGRVTIVKHRYMTISGDTNYDIVGYQSDLVKIGFLDAPHYEDRAKTGYFKSGSIVGEATIQVGHEKAVLRGQKHL